VHKINRVQSNKLISYPY